MASKLTTDIRAVSMNNANIRRVKLGQEGPLRLSSSELLFLDKSKSVCVQLFAGAGELAKFLLTTNSAFSEEELLVFSPSSTELSTIEPSASLSAGYFCDQSCKSTYPLSQTRDPKIVDMAVALFDLRTASPFHHILVIWPLSEIWYFSILGSKHPAKRWPSCTFLDT